MAEKFDRRNRTFHRSTIHRWTKVYGPMTEGYAGKIRPWTGYRWRCDEVYCMMLADGAYLFTVMDHSTGPILSCVVSPVKVNAKPLEMFMRRPAGPARSRGCSQRAVWASF